MNKVKFELNGRNTPATRSVRPICQKGNINTLNDSLKKVNNIN